MKKIVFNWFITIVLITLAIICLNNSFVSKTQNNPTPTILVCDKPSNHIQDELILIRSINRNIPIGDAYEIIDAVNKHYYRSGLSKLDLYSLCGWESRLRKDAKSPDNNDIGICQINKTLYRSLVKQKVISNEWHKINNIDYNFYVATKLLEYNKPFIDKLLIGNHNALNRRVVSIVAYNNMKKARTNDFGYFVKVEKIRSLIRAVQ